MDPTDTALLKRYRRGDVEALGVLVERHRRALYGYIIGMCRSRHEADEVFQDVWKRVIEKVEHYRDRNFRGWLMRIAHNRVIDRARKRKPDVSLDAAGESGGALGDVVADGRPGPRAGLAWAEVRADVARAVAELPPEQREVFLMRAVSEMPFKDIARAQRVSINTALARMQYALAKLRTALGPDYTADAAAG
jgi:RNA polymerase sigma-70 factor, ECF subfamily